MFWEDISPFMPSFQMDFHGPRRSKSNLGQRNNGWIMVSWHPWDVSCPEVQFHFLKIHPNNEVDFTCELSWQTLLWILFLTYLLAYTELVSPAQSLRTPESDKEAICWMPYQPREKNRCQVKAGQPMHPSSLNTHDSLNLNHSYNL